MVGSLRTRQEGADELIQLLITVLQIIVDEDAIEAICMEEFLSGLSHTLLDHFWAIS